MLLFLGRFEIQHCWSRHWYSHHDILILCVMFSFFDLFYCIVLLHGVRSDDILVSGPMDCTPEPKNAFWIQTPVKFNLSFTQWCVFSFYSSFTINHISSPKLDAEIKSLPVFDIIIYFYVSIERSDRKPSKNNFLNFL